MVPTFLGITFVVFLICQFVPGGPIDQIKLEMAGQGERAERTDSILDWAYPIAYLGAIFGLYIWFFVIK